MFNRKNIPPPGAFVTLTLSDNPKAPGGVGVKVAHDNQFLGWMRNSKLDQARARVAQG